MDDEALLLIFTQNLSFQQKIAQRSITEDTEFSSVSLAHHYKKIASNITSDKAIFYNNFIDFYDFWENTSFQKYLQEGDGFGQKIHQALKETADAQYNRAIIIGLDTSPITEEILTTALDALSNYTAVIGQNSTQHTYLVGIKTTEITSLEKFDWNVDEKDFYQKILTFLQENNISYLQLPTLESLPEIEDIKEDEQAFFEKKITDNQEDSTNTIVQNLTDLPTNTNNLDSLE